MLSLIRKTATSVVGTVTRQGGVLRCTATPAFFSTRGTQLRMAEYPEHQIVGLPKLSPTMEEGTVQSWTVQEGEEFAEGDVICQIETDKAAVDFEATEDGFMAKHLVPAGHAPAATGIAIAITVEEKENVAAFAGATADEFASDSAPVEEAAAAAPPAPAAVATPAPPPVAAPSPVTSTPVYTPRPAQTAFSTASEKRQQEYVTAYGSTLMENIYISGEDSQEA